MHLEPLFLPDTPLLRSEDPSFLLQSVAKIGADNQISSRAFTSARKWPYWAPILSLSLLFLQVFCFSISPCLRFCPRLDLGWKVELDLMDQLNKVTGLILQILIGRASRLLIPLVSSLWLSCLSFVYAYVWLFVFQVELQAVVRFRERVLACQLIFSRPPQYLPWAVVVMLPKSIIGLHRFESISPQGISRIWLLVRIMDLMCPWKHWGKPAGFVWHWNYHLFATAFKLFLSSYFL